MQGQAGPMVEPVGSCPCELWAQRIWGGGEGWWGPG